MYDFRNLYSSEFKHVIYIYTEDCCINYDVLYLSDDRKAFYSLGHYIFLSRATINFKIIYVKDMKFLKMIS